MDRVEVTRRELVEAIRAAQKRPEMPAAMTTREIGQAMGWGDHKTRAAIKEAIEAGVLEPCRVPGTFMDGRSGWFSAYRIREIT